jgi:hypothetical protein
MHILGFGFGTTSTFILVQSTRNGLSKSMLRHVGVTLDCQLGHAAHKRTALRAQAF